MTATPHRRGYFNEKEDGREKRKRIRVGYLGTVMWLFALLGGGVVVVSLTLDEADMDIPPP